MSDTERTPSVESGISSKSAFAEAARKAEEEAGIVPDWRVGADEEDRPRDEKGRFTSTSEDAPVETVAETTEPAAAEEVRLLAGKYKTVEELERAYTEQEYLRERQANELGELRKTVEERLASYDERLNRPTPRQITPDLIEQNPGYAAQLAYTQGDNEAAAIAFEQWKLEDPAAAASWRAELVIAEREKQLRDEFEQRYRQLEEKVAPIQAQSEQQQLAAGVAALAPEVREFLTNQSTVEQLATEFPLLGNALVSGGPAEKLSAAQTLFEVHRGRTAGTLTRTEQEIARQTAEAAQQARDDAFVASAGTSQETPKSFEQQEQENAIAAFTRGRTIWADALVKSGK